jgi:TPR repeat protein
VLSSSEHFLAWQDGTHNYVTVSGSSRTIHALDYGVPCPPPREWIIQHNQAVARANAAAKLKAQSSKFIAQSNAVVWLAPQATNGVASAQYSLALHYLNGEGCATNKDLALYWLKQSSAHGNEEATSKLKGLLATSVATAGNE